MSNIIELKKIIENISYDENIKSKIKALIENLEAEIEELSFLTTRYQHDQKVNENFVKKTVSLLETSNEDLKRSNNKLIKANYELIKSNEELERFAYIASHDLKTPLYNIINFTQLLQKKLKPNNNEELLKYLHFINQGGIMMKNLIEDILEYSRLSKDNNSNKVHFNVSSIIEEILFSISKFIDFKNGKVEIQTSLPDYFGNRSSFFILFKNLIENGIKYNESPSPIVKIYCEEHNDSYSIYIEDNGIGIENKFQDQVFQMFKRLHNQSKYEGSSQLNVGTVFKINLPKIKVVT